MAAARQGAFAGLLLFAAAGLSAQAVAPDAPTGITIGLSGSEPSYWTQAAKLQVRWQAVTWPAGTSFFPKRYRVVISGPSYGPYTFYAPSAAGSVFVFPPQIDETVAAMASGTYTLRIWSGYYDTDVTLVESTTPAVRTFQVDVAAPTAGLSGLAPTQSSTSFTVSWSGSDDLSGIASYDVQVSAQVGAWQDWLKATTAVSATFLGSNGATYGFRVRARDKAGNVGAYASGDVAATTINAGGAALAITVSPSLLTFGANENTKDVSLTIKGTGTGPIQLSTLREKRTYSDGATEIVPPSVLSATVGAGGSAMIGHSVGLDAFQRAHALGASTQGSFTLGFEVTGTDALGATVKASASMPVSVSGGFAGGLTVTGVSLALPAGPYYVGDLVEGATVKIQATGSGVVSGQVKIDGSTAWSANPGFSVPVSGDTSFAIPGSLPTDASGDHVLSVELVSPPLSAQAAYSVVANPSGFPPKSLTLVPGVAELSSLAISGPVYLDSYAGYDEYTFSGQGTLKLLSLAGAVVDQATMTDVVVRYYKSAPTVPVVCGGHVDRAAAGAAPLLVAAGGSLKVRALHFEGKADTPQDHLAVDAAVSLPQLSPYDLFLLEGIALGAGGLEDASFAWAKSAAVDVPAFGLTLRVYQPGGSAYAVSFRKDGSRYAFDLAGSLLLAVAGSAAPQELTAFKGLTLYSDGTTAPGTLAFGSPYTIIPNALTFDAFEILSSAAGPHLGLAGKIAPLAAPLDKLGQRSFEALLKPDGTLESTPAAVSEAHGLAGGDATEWAVALGTLDVTYLAPQLSFVGGLFHPEQSSVRVALDLYLNLTQPGGGALSPAERRISFGEPAGAAGVTLGSDGKETWVPLPASETAKLQGKVLAVASTPLTVTISALAVQPTPFRLALNGTILLGAGGVTGGVAYTGMKLGLDGSLDGPDIVQSDLVLAGALKVRVEEMAWSAKAETLVVSEPAGGGSGPPQQATQSSIPVTSSYKLTGPSVSFQAAGVTLAGGTYGSLTVYHPQSGPTGYFLQGADLSLLAGTLQVKADLKNRTDGLGLAGTVHMAAIPQEVTALGTVGQHNGASYFGVFLSASGLTVPLAPGVFLNEIGGGVFVNPEPQDLAWVKAAAGFSRPDLNDLVSAKMPASSSSFALALLGGVYVASPDAVKGRALVTVTAKTFELNAQVEAAAGALTGRADLEVGWSPAYALGSAQLSLSFLSAVEGTATMEFYVFDSSKWGIFGGGNVAMFGHSMSKVDFFLGPPGFSLTGGASYGIDLYVISGSVSYGVTFWYYTASDPDNAGAYATVSADGDFLDGLFSATAGLSGALIVGSDVFVYAVGHVKAKVCGVTVFNGSLWISVGTNGIHGNTGSNSDYDALIAQANQMASEMKAMKKQLLDDLDKALAQLAALSDQQLAAAGKALVARAASDWDETLFGVSELYWWGIGKYPASLGPVEIGKRVLQNKDLPAPLQQVYDVIFGPQGSALAKKRADLQAVISDLQEGQGDLKSRQQKLSERLTAYEDLLSLQLPSVQDLGNLGNPLKGRTEETLKLGDQTLKVPVTFSLDANQASSQAQQVATVRAQFEKYQSAFIEQAGIIDAKLAQLDEILSSGSDSLTSVLESFGYQYARNAQFIDDYTKFHGQYIDYAVASLFKLVLGQTDSQIEGILSAKAAGVPANTLSQWGQARRSYMDFLISMGGADPGSVPSKAFQGSGTELFKVTGMDLWRNVPIAGFKAGIEVSKQQRALALQSYADSGPDFRYDWSETTATADKYFRKKADLYGVLYEIYDQLATYGTGTIAVASDGNATGFGKLSVAGLSFRSSAVAKAVLAGATPAGQQPPAAGSGGGFQKQAKAVIIGGAPPSGGGLKLVSQPVFQGGGSGNASPGPPVALGANSLGMTTATFDRSVSAILGAALASAYAFVPVPQYFAAKRAEVEPYLAIPSFPTMGGQVTSATKYDALLQMTLGATHPIGVVEYAYRIEAVPASSKTVKPTQQLWLINQAPLEVVPFVGIDVTTTQLTMPSGPALHGFLQNLQGTQKGDYTDAYLGAKPDFSAAFVSVPWYSMGKRTQISETFLPDLEKEGTYRVLARARGAGGRTITRAGTFTLKYRNGSAGSPVVTSAVDASDSTPPPPPQVLVDRGFFMTGAAIHAQWSADDPQSGIQKYEYRISDYVPPSGTGTGAGLQMALGNLNLFGAGSQPSFKQRATTIELLGAGAKGGSSWLTETTQPAQNLAAALAWHAAGGLTEANIRDVPLLAGHRYVVDVRATNGAGLTGTGSSQPFLVDGTPPSAPAITAFVQATVNADPASVKFTFQPGTDAESGIDAHYFAIGTAAGKDDLVEWTPLAGTGGSVVGIKTASGTITLSIRAVNKAGAQTVVSKTLAFAGGQGGP